MRLLGHPVHPMVAHFPIVFWSCAVAADLVGLLTHASLAAQLASGTLALGCVSGLLAIVAGLFDFIGIPQNSPARGVAVTHLMVMCCAWIIFLLGLALHGYPPNALVSIAAFSITAAGFLTMAYGAWLGGKLVYEFGVGSRGNRSGDA